jgi:hypothetical protein
MHVSSALQLARGLGMCCSQAMNAFATSHLFNITASAVRVAAIGLNNNANNNTRNHGWAGV